MSFSGSAGAKSTLGNVTVVGDPSLVNPLSFAVPICVAKTPVEKSLLATPIVTGLMLWRSSSNCKSPKMCLLQAVLAYVGLVRDEGVLLFATVL